MKRISFALVAVILLGGSPALANSCYSAQEAEAEQGIRIHSELMVIGLNCMHMTPPGEKNFYMRYREFTAAHEDLFADYENRLINYYRKSGAGNPEGRLNDLRTDFANKISKDAADMRPDVFCSRYIERLQKVAGMDRAKLVKWASTFYPSHPVSHPICQ
jgi:hypothetical protein